MGEIIEYTFKQNRWKIILFNLLYLLQLVFVVFSQFNEVKNDEGKMVPLFDKDILKMIMIVTASILIIVELSQILEFGKLMNYLSNPMNYIELSGNVIVILVQTEVVASLNVLMVFLMVIKGITLLKLFKGFRTMMCVIFECFKGLIPFQIILLITIGLFALMDLTIDSEAKSNSEDMPLSENYLRRLTQNYVMLFDDLPEISFANDSILKWAFFILFTNVVMIILLNVLIAVVVNDY